MRMAVGPAWLQLVASAWPAVILATSFLLLRLHLGYTTTDVILRSSAIGIVGVVAYALASIFELQIASKLYSFALPSYNETTLLQAYGHDWAFALLYMGLFVAVVARLNRGVARPA